MLPITATTLPRDRARRLDPFRGCLKNLNHMPSIEPLAFLGDLDYHSFSWQSARDENHLVVDPPDDNSTMGDSSELNLSFHLALCLASRCRELLSW